MIDLPREIVLKILYDVNEKGAYSNIAINKYIEKFQFKEIDKNYNRHGYGTINKRLLTIISQF